MRLQNIRTDIIFPYKAKKKGREAGLKDTNGLACLSLFAVAVPIAALGQPYTRDSRITSWNATDLREFLLSPSPFPLLFSSPSDLRHDSRLNFSKPKAARPENVSSAIISRGTAR